MPITRHAPVTESTGTGIGLLGTARHAARRAAAHGCVAEAGVAVEQREGGRLRSRGSLHASVGADQPRGRDSDCRMPVEPAHHVGEGTRPGVAVAVEEAGDAARQPRQRAVVSGGEAQVGLVDDHLDLGELAADAGHGVVPAGVVDAEDLGSTAPPPPPARPRRARRVRSAVFQERTTTLRSTAARYRRGLFPRNGDDGSFPPRGGPRRLRPWGTRPSRNKRRPGPGRRVRPRLRGRRRWLPRARARMRLFGRRLVTLLGPFVGVGLVLWGIHFFVSPRVAYELMILSAASLFWLGTTVIFTPILGVEAGRTGCGGSPCPSAGRPSRSTWACGTSASG